jgi:hypothetical protein
MAGKSIEKAIHVISALPAAGGSFVLPARALQRFSLARGHDNLRPRPFRAPAGVSRSTRGVHSPRRRTMQREQHCPECGTDARMIGVTIECEDGPRYSDIVETYSYFCAACQKAWDVRISEAGRIHVSQTLAAIHR